MGVFPAIGFAWDWPSWPFGAGPSAEQAGAVTPASSSLSPEQLLAQVLGAPLSRTETKGSSRRKKTCVTQEDGVLKKLNTLAESPSVGQWVALLGNENFCNRLFDTHLDGGSKLRGEFFGKLYEAVESSEAVREAWINASKQNILVFKGLVDSADDASHAFELTSRMFGSLENADGCELAADYMRCHEIESNKHNPRNLQNILFRPNVCKDPSFLGYLPEETLKLCESAFVDELRAGRLPTNWIFVVQRFSEEAQKRVVQAVLTRNSDSLLSGITKVEDCAIWKPAARDMLLGACLEDPSAKARLVESLSKASYRPLGFSENELKLLEKEAFKDPWLSRFSFRLNRDICSSIQECGIQPSLILGMGNDKVGALRRLASWGLVEIALNPAGAQGFYGDKIFLSKDNASGTYKDVIDNAVSQLGAIKGQEAGARTYKRTAVEILKCLDSSKPESAAFALYLLACSYGAYGKEHDPYYNPVDRALKKLGE